MWIQWIQQPLEAVVEHHNPAILVNEETKFKVILNG
jgi:hypothetical protein